jgi:hypothetical protein
MILKKQEKQEDFIDKLVRTVPLYHFPPHLFFQQFSQANPGRINKGTRITGDVSVVFLEDGPEIRSSFIHDEGGRLQFTERIRKELPFGVLTLEEIGERFGEFIQQCPPKDRTAFFKFFQFVDFVRKADPYSRKNGVPAEGTNIFKDDCIDKKNIFLRNREICKLSGAGEKQICARIKKIEAAANRISVEIVQNGTGFLNYIDVPLSYAQSMTRNEMSSRLCKSYEKMRELEEQWKIPGHGWKVFNSVFESFVVFESTLGIFPVESLNVLSQMYLQRESYFFHRNKTTNLPELFVQFWQKDSNKWGEIGIIEGSFSGKEEQKKRRFVGEILLKGELPVKKWVRDKQLER